MRNLAVGQFGKTYRSGDPKRPNAKALGYQHWATSHKTTQEIYGTAEESAEKVGLWAAMRKPGAEAHYKESTFGMAEAMP